MFSPFGLAIESIKEFGGVSIIHIDTFKIFGKSKNKKVAI
jgi:hypothetical protein